MEQLTVPAGPLRILVASPTAAQSLGQDWSAFDSDVARLSLGAQLADAVAALHDRGLARGDVTLHSAVLTGAGVVLASADSPPGWHTPFFLPPEVADGTREQPDQCTDIYQLGLCVIRLLARGPGAIQLRDPLAVATALGPAGVELLARAVGRDRDRRPAAREVAALLHDRVRELTRPPQLLDVAVLRPIELPGADAIVTWTQQHGTWMRIYGLNGFEVAGLDPGGHPNGYTIRPSTTGPIFIEITNPYGSVTRQAGFIAFYEPPRLALEKHLPGRLPRLAVPDLPAVPAPRRTAPLPRPPTVATDEHPPPRLNLPAMREAVVAARPGSDRTGIATVGALVEVSQYLNAAVRETLRETAQDLRDQLATAARAHAAHGEGSAT